MCTYVASVLGYEQAKLVGDPPRSTAKPPLHLKFWTKNTANRGQPDLSVSPQNEASREEKGGENVR
jgi:hypothetical protein